MITVISGTNRKDGITAVFARHYADLLISMTDEPVQMLDMSTIPYDWIHPDMYEVLTQSESLHVLQDRYILGAQKFFFVFPEYNGSLPGILKLFIDACSIREYKANFKGKCAGMAGIATGRAGNLRGMDHLSDVLNHMGTVVHPFRLPISNIGKILAEDGMIDDAATLLTMEKHARDFLEFSGSFTRVLK